MVDAPQYPIGAGVGELRDRIISGDVGVAEVVRAHLDRLDDVQPTLNAAVEICRERAMLEAARLQSRLTAGEAPGALCGIPFSVKDVIATEGVLTRCGSRAFSDNVPQVDAAAVRRLRDAGAILIAKSNCPEFAFGVTTDNEAFGVTRNPFGEHSPGGSSGGEAALVAAGASVFGVGTDYGGSLRWPAQCCGVVAIRGGLALVDGTGQLPEVGGRMDGRSSADPTGSVQRHFQVVGPITRSVADIATVLAVMARTEFDLDGPPAAIGWLDTEDSEMVGAAVRDCIHHLVTRLSDAGMIVQHLPGLFDGLHDSFNALRSTDPLADLRAAVGARLDRVGAGPRSSLATAPSSIASTPALWADIDQRRARVLEQLTRTPVLLFPVGPAPACDIDGSVEVDGRIISGFALMAQCRAVTALGMPALSIPIGSDDAGLPISVQVIAAPGREELVLRTALRIEQITGGAIAPPWLAPSRPTIQSWKESE